MLSFPAMVVRELIWERQELNSTNAQNNDDDFDDGYYNWWWTPTGEAVRYSIAAAFFAAVLLYVTLGYMHARRRAQKGLPLLAYHRWMMRRPAYPPTSYVQYHPYAHMPGSDQQPGYAMHSYPPPPPAYNPAEMPPPVYQPPEGASKVMADQSYPVPSARVGEASTSDSQR